MKKKALLLCLAVVAAAVISGSMAFFTDAVESEGNVITSGNIHVLQHEYERVRDDLGYTGSFQPFTQQKAIYPCAIHDLPSPARGEYTLGNATVQLLDESGVIDKLVTAENAGRNISYVRTYIAIPARYTGNEGVTWLHMDMNPDPNWVWCSAPLKNQQIAGQAYDIYMAEYQLQLNPGDETTPCLLGFYMDGKVDSNGNAMYYVDDQGMRHELGKGSSLTVLVTTEASQAIVFENAKEALDASFGKFEDGHHPWLKKIQVKDQAGLDTALTSAGYDTEIVLEAGEYTLPAALPNGVRIHGLTQDVKLTVNAAGLSAYDCEFDRVTFLSALKFSGHGSFENVLFMEDVTGDIRNITLFDACHFMKRVTCTGSQDLITFTRCIYPDPLQP
ncbi:MAG: hypothetical protein E7324_09125 [Clostridiales bacterium]|nr:hypothetical protein [Clostridiales bacterium]